MATTHKWTAPSTTLTSLLTTELNSLASAGVSAAGTEYDNNSNLHLYAWFVLDVTFGSSPTDKSAVDIYIAKAFDGTNYQYSAVPRSPDYVGSFLVKDNTSAQKHVIGPILVPPCKFKLVLVNSTNQAFPASGSTVKAALCYEQDV
jgi:hypothetical protein